MKILIIDTFHESLQILLEDNGYECINMAQSSDEDVRMAMPIADVLILRSRISIDTDFIDASPNLKIIGRVGAGLEHIDVNYAKSKGIKVLSSPEGNRQAVAEHSIGMLLALFNKIPKSNVEVRKGHWLRKENEGIELKGKTVGILGFGNTGSAFAQVISGFGVKILAFDKYKSNHSHDATMEQIWDEADVVSIHLPMTNETKFLVSEAWLKRFKRPIYIINTSRGTIVNTEDLLKAMDETFVLGACLDVLEFETENLKMPRISELPTSATMLFNHPNVILTPHTAGLTKQSYEKLSQVLAHKILVELKDR